MIEIKNKKECCGCLACVQICPNNCIDIETDEQGFHYPKVNQRQCVNCVACEKVCPIINADNHTNLGDDTLSYACYNKNDEVRRNSSSGGFFTLIAEYVISKHGVVFGAKFDDDWHVVHSYTETIEEIENFRRSKYVQSYIGESFQQVRAFLREGRLVLFSGTPCQVAGLNKFLRRNYDNLICLDFICHGVPSPIVWDKYLKEKKNKFAIDNNVDSPDNIEIVKISFRDKTNGWRKYSLSISYKIKDKDVLAAKQKTEVEYIWENDYMLCFLKDFINRPSCFDCKFRNGRSHSDITMGDFWGVEKIINDVNYAGEKGTSILFVHNRKVIDVIDNLDMKKQIVKYSKAKDGNPAIFRDWKKPIWHSTFFKTLEKNEIKSVLQKYEFIEEITNAMLGFIKKIISIPLRIWRKLV